eukprot:1521787-Pyramimonas_sp.AAC.1
MAGIRESLRESLLFDKLSGQELHLGKLVAWTTDENSVTELANTTVCGHNLPVERAFRLVGSQINTRGGDDTSIMDRHFVAAVQRLQRAQRSPLLLHKRADIAQTMAASM